MNNENLTPELLTIRELFEQQAIYTVPIYQRNYAWGENQIQQLISDIGDAMRSGDDEGYFLGNLIVTRRPKPAPQNDFEVVDGQQRLTTLYLLLTYLQKHGTPFTQHQGRLRYEARARATAALQHVGEHVGGPARALSDSASDEDSGIHNAYYQFIRQNALLRNEGAAFANYLRDRVTVVRATLPPNTDLNRYFEVMNTRGQQLKQVDIVKAQLMRWLTSDSERATFAWIWEACADMDSYVQMALTRDNTALRDKIFGNDWSWLCAQNFDALINARQTADANTSMMAGEALSLDDALTKYACSPQPGVKEVEGKNRFRSTVEFTAFLLQVLKVQHNDTAEHEGHLDDKTLIKSFAAAIPKGQEAQWVRDFAFSLLKCRNLFDNFILKREFVSGTKDELGDWSLQRLTKRISSGRSTPGYAHVFSKTGTEAEEDSAADTDTRDVLLLQSMLRITYTSPRTMHWITKVLQWLVAVQNSGAVSSIDLANLLRDYARGKVAAAFSFIEGQQPQGFNIGRIVFTYLDYLLLDPQSTQGFKFQFRTSIEHFYPQNPNGGPTGTPVSDGKLNLLGNLALVSVSANSRFSNNPPEAKALTYKKDIKILSPKLQRMAEITDREGWGDAQVQAHHEEMVALLQADIQKNSS